MNSWAIICFLYVGIMIAINVVFAVLCAIGGFYDLAHLFRELKNAKIDETDDGRVVKKLE